MANVKSITALTLFSVGVSSSGSLLAGDGDNSTTESKQNSVSINFIYLDSPNGKFGEYSGLNSEHSNVVLSLDSSGKDDQASAQYWDVTIHNLGLDTFFVKGEYGEQGNYRLRAGFDQLEKIYHDDALTIYDNQLNVLASPRKKTTKSKRKTSNFGYDKFFGGRWELATNFKSQKKEGSRPRPVNGGLIVPQDLDFQHTEIEASLTYSEPKIQLVLSSYFSDFENDNDLIMTTAAEPDNSFYQVSASGGYNIDKTSRATAYLSYSEAEQDDSFSNYGISSGTYLANSLDAEYDTLNFQLGYRNRLTPKLYLDIKYRLESRGNDTPLYSDFPSSKNNKVYEWDKHKLDIKTRYRLPARWRLRAGLRFTDYQYEVNKSPTAGGRLTEQAPKLSDDSEEMTTWAEIRSPMLAGFYGSLKYSYSDRDVDLDTIREQAASVDTGGIALSGYLVDRKRDKINLLLTHSFSETISTSFSLSLTEDDYDAIAWASLDSTDTTMYTVDLNYSPSRDYSFNVYAGVETFEVEQSGFGSLSTSSTAWNYRIEDDSDLVGFTATLRDLAGMVDVSIDYRYQKGEGDYETNDPSNVSGSFPDLDTTVSSITIKADIDLADDLSINTRYVYEDYDSESWVWKNDFNDPGTTYSSTLNYGYDSPSYNTHLIMVGATYQF